MVLVAIAVVVLVGGFVAWRCSPLSAVNLGKVVFGGGIEEVDYNDYYEPNGAFRHANADDTLAFYMRHPLFEGDTNMIYSADDKISRLINATSGATLEQFCVLNGMMGSLIADHAVSIVGGDYAGKPTGVATASMSEESPGASAEPAQDKEADESSPQAEAEDGIEAFNYLIDQANADRITYLSRIYDDAAVDSDPAKSAVHAVLYHGDPDKPLAIVMPGGGFISVGCYADAYTYAQKLHERGYNVAVLVYRVGDQLHTDDQWQRGIEAVNDLAALVSYVQAHGDELNVSLEDYAVFGSSAGGLMATAFSFDSFECNASSFGLPRPTLCVCNYGLYWDVEPTEADAGLAVFAVAGADDPFGFGGVAQRVPALENYLGAENVSVRVAPHYRHGSNLGDGTVFEGWIDEAMEFWESHR